MTAFVSLHNGFFGRLDRASELVLPTLARLTFAAVLLLYFWQSAVTKLGDGAWGLFFLSDGAYVQIFPRAMAAAGYDSSQLGGFHWLVAFLGMTAEFVLPALIVIGLFSRLSALGMIGFVVMQSLTDVLGHGLADPATLGAWFDRFPAAPILDQRLLWSALLLIVVFKGAGPLSADRLLTRLA